MGVPAIGSLLSGTAEEAARDASSGPYAVALVSISIRMRRLGSADLSIHDSPHALLKTCSVAFGP